MDELALARDDVELEHVVDLEAMAEGLAADPADGERAADAELDVVGERGRALPEGHGGLRGAGSSARRASTSASLGVDLVDGREGRHVDEDARLHLGLPVGAVAQPLAQAARAADL